MATKKTYEVEVYNCIECDTDYDRTKSFATYKAAVNYARKCKDLEDSYVFIYVPKGDGSSLREEWTGGRHDAWLDCKVY